MYKGIPFPSKALLQASQRDHNREQIIEIHSFALFTSDGIWADGALSHDDG